jgi:hypothetical protein
MAKISHSDDAPKEQIHYTFAGAEFDLGGRKKSYDTEDLSVIQSAQGHPWLVVEFPEDPEGSVGTFVDGLAPEDDAFSFINDQSNVPEVAEAAEEAKADDDINPAPLDPADASKTSDEKDQD